MKGTLVLFLALTALALAKGSWPEGTQFALLDSSGHVLWTYTEGQDLTQVPAGLLAQAASLRITLPDGTVAYFAVTVKGNGQGLGEVKLFVDGKPLPLPELLNAPGVALKDGQLVVSRGKGKPEDEHEDEEHTKGQNASAHKGQTSATHGQGHRGR